MSSGKKVDVYILAAAVAEERGLKAAPQTAVTNPQGGVSLVREAERHKLLQCLGRYADAHPDILDAEGTKLLKTLLIPRKFISSKIQEEWLRISRAFHDAGIPLLSMKGPALSQLLYKDPALRESRDLDFLVDVRSFRDIHGIMAGLGWKPKDYHPLPVDRCLESGYWLLSHHMVYTCPSVPFTVEIHNRAWKRTVDGFPLDARTLLRSSQLLSLGGESLLVPQRGWHLAYMVFHGTAHGWCLLHWVADFAALWTQMDKELENEFLQAVAALGLEEQVMEAVTVASRFFTLPVREGWEPKTSDLKFSQYCINYLTGESPYMPSSIKHIQRTVEKRFKLGEDSPKTVYRFLVPSPTDTRKLPLPSNWQFLHYFLRPWFVSQRVLGRTLASLKLRKLP